MAVFFSTNIFFREIGASVKLHLGARSENGENKTININYDATYVLFLVSSLPFLFWPHLPLPSLSDKSLFKAKPGLRLSPLSLPGA